MAKGQKKSNKEIRKPKASKIAAATTQPLFSNGSLTPPLVGKKKKAAEL